MFTKKDIWKLLIPLMVEQLLNALMGTADTMMVSNVGPAALSAVSLVDSINTLMILVFSALATGGAIVCSQYIGQKNIKAATNAGRQLLLSILAFSLAIMTILIIFRRPLLSLVFGSVEPAVMENALLYMLLTAISYPFIAMYNASAALFRASGNSRFPMTVSMISNGINIAGNALFIFGFGMGVAGAAISTLISRIFCAAVVLYYQRKPKQAIVIDHYLRIRPDWHLIGTILSIGIPAGIENGMFQFGKLAIQSTVSTLGTTAIAAQAMTAILEQFNGMAAIGIGLGLMTIAGQCIGAGRIDEARKYTRQLCIYSEIAVFISCILTLVFTKPITWLAGMNAEGAAMCLQMSLAITIVKPLVWVLSFLPAYAMRAAGDVKFCMIISSITMWICRVSLTVILCRFFGFGPMAVWIGMFADWTVRAIIFPLRFRSGRWAARSVIHS